MESALEPEEQWTWRGVWGGTLCLLEGFKVPFLCANICKGFLLS